MIPLVVLIHRNGEYPVEKVYMGIVFSGVTLCNFQSLCRDVPCLDLTAGQRERKSNGNATASGSQIGYAQGLTGVSVITSLVNSSVSGRGMRAPGAISKRRPQKSVYPKMY